MQTVEQFFNLQCANFAQGELEQFAKAFALPAGIYFNEQIRVLKTRDHIQAVLRKRRNALIAAQYMHTEFRIFAQSIETTKHLSAWVELRHLTAGKNLLSSSTARHYFTRQENSLLKVQLVEILERAPFREPKAHSAPSAGVEHPAMLSHF